MQNSGVGYIGDVIRGLHAIYDVGVILVIDCIGEHEDTPPQHRSWGLDRTRQMLWSLGMAWADPMEQAGAYEAVASSAWRLNRPSALLIRKGYLNVD
jgi:hypothetical protein